MSTSDKRIMKDLRATIAAAAFTALFGAVYEHYSHEVYSCFMIYAFAVPLIMGALPYSVIAASGRKAPPEVSLLLWNSSIAAFTVGSLFKGVLDIYGTTNRLAALYPAAGILLAVLAAVMGAVKRREDTHQSAETGPGTGGVQ